MIANLFEVKTNQIKWSNGLRVAVALFVPLIVMGALSFQGGASQALPQALAWLIGGALFMLLALVKFERQSSSPAPAQGSTPAQSPGSLLATYFAFFRFTSQQFLFVLLKALMITIGIAIGLGFHLTDAYWIPVYTLIVLQADYKQTLGGFVLRVLGTIIGAILAAILLGIVHNQYIIALLVLILTIFGVAMHDANMLFYICLTTMVILLLLGLQSPGSFTVLWVRVLNVSIGAALAVVLVVLFMRPSETKQNQSKQLSSDTSG